MRVPLDWLLSGRVAICSRQTGWLCVAGGVAPRQRIRSCKTSAFPMTLSHCSTACEGAWSTTAEGCVCGYPIMNIGYPQIDATPFDRWGADA